MSTCASWRTVGVPPPEERVPQPVIVQLVPAGAFDSERATVPTQLFNSMGDCSLISPKSLEYLLLL